MSHLELPKSDLRKGFAIWPVKLVSGKRIWLRKIYYRYCEWDPIGSPDYAGWYEYFTPEEASLLILQEDAKVTEFALPFERQMLFFTKTSTVLMLVLLFLVISYLGF
jgi:hypothetical protein